MFAKTATEFTELTTSSAAQQRVWFGLLRVVHLAALLLFSAKRKGIFFSPDKNHGGAARFWYICCAG
ncbi:MFS transporter (organic cation transporter) [Sarotherodon galilaeus]